MAQRKPRYSDDKSLSEHEEELEAYGDEMLSMSEVKEDLKHLIDADHIPISEFWCLRQEQTTHLAKCNSQCQQCRNHSTLNITNIFNQ